MKVLFVTSELADFVKVGGHGRNGMPATADLSRRAGDKSRSFGDRPVSEEPS
jgi:hypothetical protein